MSNKLILHLEEIKKLPKITLGKLVDCLQAESLLVLCLVSILPFMQPIPIPGLSTILGLVVLMQGVAMILWSKPWLTKKMQAVQIPHDKFETIVKMAKKLSPYLDRISFYKHPWTNSRASHILCGAAIVLSGAFLALPLPIPMTNTIPSLSIAFICIGLLEEDLALLLVGLLISLSVIGLAFLSYHLLKVQILNFL